MAAGTLTTSAMSAPVVIASVVLCTPSSIATAVACRPLSRAARATVKEIPMASRLKVMAASARSAKFPRTVSNSFDRDGHGHEDQCGRPIRLTLPC